jgi:hypothetical protein
MDQIQEIINKIEDENVKVLMREIFHIISKLGNWSRQDQLSINEIIKTLDKNNIK